MVAKELTKENHPGEGICEKGPKKSFIQKIEELLRGAPLEAEIQLKPLGRGKNLAFSEDTSLEKERVRLKVTPRKVGVGLKRRREPSKSKMGWKVAWWGSTEKKEVSHLLGLRERHQYSDQRSNQNRALCVASTAVRTEGRRTKWEDCQRRERS